jgi:Ca2+-binding RTX toxin-like protein
MTKKVDFTTYDLRGCPKGGLLSGTDKPDNLAGRDGDDEIRGLGAEDYLIGGLGNDVIYGGTGSDRLADWPLAGWWGGGKCGGTLPFEQRICTEVSAKAGAMTCFTEATGTTIWGQTRERMSSTAAMATIMFLTRLGSGSRTNSIAAKAMTYTVLTRTTMWTAVASAR